jgi:hypothetical protein
MVLEAIYVVRHGVSLPIPCPLRCKQTCRRASAAAAATAAVSFSAGMLNATGVPSLLLARDCCMPFGRHLQECEAYGLAHKTLHATPACPTMTSIIATEQNTDLSSSVPTGSSIPRLESTTAPFVHRQAFPQIQHSPATELHRPSNWPSTSSPPTQRSMPSTQALSTVAFRHLHRSPQLARHRTTRIPRP